MSNEMRLARVDFGPGWIDLGYGEPVVVQEILQKHIGDLISNQCSFLPSQYQPAQGNKKLVELLEKKYDAKVVVTNGAKQGISAVMYALKKYGHTSCTIHAPYWVSTPGLITDIGLKVETLDSGQSSSRAFMVTSPNNPDGRELSKEQFENLEKEAREDLVTLIHDAAYYTPIYMENPLEQTKVGSAQIYSFSKMYGLSGLRVGYVVLHDPSLLPGVVEYVERTCSGVSTASQEIALAVESYFLSNPKALSAFETECREAIAASRRELANLDPEVMVVEPCASNSMFAWAKAGPKLDAVEAKVNIIAGDGFGRPGMVRLNLAVNSDLMRTAIERLNEKAKKI